MPPTRQRLGHRSTDRTGVGIPDRFGIRARRSSGPQRSVSDPGERKAPAGCNPGNAPENERERKEERRIPRVLYPSGDVPRPGRQNRKCGRGERPEHPRVQLGLAEPESEESSCDRSPGSTGRPFPAEMPDEPGTSAKPDYTLCYTSRSGRCFRLILPEGWKPFGMEPAGKCMHLAHSVY